MKKFIKKMNRTTSKDNQKNYTERFFKEAEIPARFGKTIYIRKEYHQKMQSIVRTIGKDEVSLFSFLDNVIAEHFERHYPEIKEMYDAEYSKPLF